MRVARPPPDSLLPRTCAPSADNGSCPVPVEPACELVGEDVLHAVGGGLRGGVAARDPDGCAADRPIRGIHDPCRELATPGHLNAIEEGAAIKERRGRCATD